MAAIVLLADFAIKAMVDFGISTEPVVRVVHVMADVIFGTVALIVIGDGAWLVVTRLVHEWRR